MLHPNALKSLAPQGQGYLLLPERTAAVSFAVLERIAGHNYPLPRRAAAAGLDLERKFVWARAESIGEPARRQGGSHVPIP